MSAKPKKIVYHENYLLKKEGVKTWISYWAMIRGKWLQFYEILKSGEKPVLRKTLELPTTTQCSLVKRNKRRFPFSINNGMGTYYIKCETELERYHWIFSILSAALGRPKTDLPKVIPDSMIEKEAFKKPAKENREPLSSSPTKSSSSSDRSSPIKQSSSPTKQPTTALDVHNKRRQKYAIRNENRAKRKAMKRAKKLGLNPEPIEYTKKPTGELRRTKNIRFNSQSNSRTQSSLDVFSDKVTELKHNKMKSSAPDLRDIKHDFYRDMPHTRDEKHELKVKTQSSEHPETNLTVKAMINPRNNASKITGDKNLAFDADDADDDIDVYPQLRVKFETDHLPNMIVTEFSDSDSDSDSDTDTPNTANTSLTSDNSTFLSLSGSNSAMTTRTYISKNDDDIYEQHSSDGRVIASPNIARKRGDLIVNQQKVRPTSPGKSLMIQKNLLDRPVTPTHERPLTPKSSAHFSRFLVNSTMSNA